jgi:hypothetical protein
MAEMFMTLQRTIALLLCVTLAAAGCATTGTMGTAPAYVGSQSNATRSVLVEYVQKLPPGTLVRVDRSHGRSVRGTLMKATDQSLFIQPKTRIAEPTLEVPFATVVAVTPEQKHGNSVGRAIGAGAAAGAAATLVIFLIAFALAGD